MNKDVENQKVHFEKGVKEKLGEKCKFFPYQSNKCVITDRDKIRQGLPSLKCQDQIDHYSIECQVSVKNTTMHESVNSCCVKLKNLECVENKILVIKKLITQ